MAGDHEALPVDPDCQVGKHRACPGTTWSDDRDDWVECGCPCHTTPEPPSAPARPYGQGGRAPA